MAEIRPFKGILYNLEKAGKLEDIVAPPYDVINNSLQESLYQKSEYNVVRLILGKTFAVDNDRNNRYTRAARDLNNWLQKGVLQQNGSECLYYYSQEYFFKEEKKKRIGLIARVKLEEYEKGVIFPHEFTLAKPKVDRLNLMRACRANFSQVFSLYSDPQKKIDSLIEQGIKGQHYLVKIKDPDGIIHSFANITDKSIIEQIVSLMNSKVLYIADGHHRYETALTYRMERRKEQTDLSEIKPYDYVMMYLTNMDSEGMSILPIHRLLFNKDDFQPDQLFKSLETIFTIEKFSFNNSADKDKMCVHLFEQMKCQGEDRFALGMYSGDGAFYFLVLKDDSILYDKLDDSKPKDFCKLDTYILHSLILEKIMEIKEESIKNQEYICFKKNEKEAIEMVDSGKCQLAFFLNSTKMDQIKRVVGSGIRMPQKSTFFYPKLLSGLVINPLDV